MSIRRRLLSGDTDTPQARMLKKGEETGGLDITLRDSSGVEGAWDIEVTVEQSGTAGYTADLVNVVETTTGSGDKKLLDRQVGGVSKFSVDGLGNVTANNVNASDVAANAVTLADAIAMVLTASGGSTIQRNDTDGVIQILGADSLINGPAVLLYGKDHATFPNAFRISGLPTSLPATSDTVWNNSGVLSIS